MGFKSMHQIDGGATDDGALPSREDEEYADLFPAAEDESASKQLSGKLIISASSDFAGLMKKLASPHVSTSGGKPDLTSRNNTPAVPDQVRGIPSTSGETPAASFSSSSKESIVDISGADHGLIAHLLNEMNQYPGNLRAETEEDVHTIMFNTMGRFHPQLFHAMVAFSALHLAQTEDGSITDAELRYQKSLSLLLQDGYGNTPLDATIFTVWFLLLYQQLSPQGIPSFSKLLTHLSGVLDNYKADDTTKEETFTNLGAQTLVWLSTLAVQGVSANAVGGHHFLGSLEKFQPLRKVLKEPVESSLDGPLPRISEPVSPGEFVDHNGILLIMLRINLLRGMLVGLSWMAKNDETDNTANKNRRLKLTWIAKDLTRLDHILARNAKHNLIGIPTKERTRKINVSSSGYNDLHTKMCLGLAIIEHHQLLVSSKVGGPSEEDRKKKNLCAETIIRYVECISKHRLSTPRFFCPSVLFTAAINSDKEADRALVLEIMKEAEKFSTHFRRMRVLLEAVYERQLKNPLEELDIREIQKQTIGFCVY